MLHLKNYYKIIQKKVHRNNDDADKQLKKKMKQNHCDKIKSDQIGNGNTLETYILVCKSIKVINNSYWKSCSPIFSSS